MRQSISRQIWVLVGLLSTALFAGQASATEEWLFPKNAYPQDILLYSYVMNGAVDQADMHHDDSVSDERQLQASSRDVQAPTRHLGRQAESSDDQQFCDYWVPDKSSESTQ